VGIDLEPTNTFATLWALALRNVGSSAPNLVTSNVGNELKAGKT
jgi:hypothetical protein